MKTLDQIEPRTPVDAAHTPGSAEYLYIINQPGSYYLTGNINGLLGKSGIEINSSNVTLDLNGFSMIGVPGSLNAIEMPVATHTAIAIRNGTITAWGGLGVIAFALAGGLFENLILIGNGNTGLVAGEASVVTACVAIYNTGPGIIVNGQATVTACGAYGNGSYGISVSSGTVENCSAHDNGNAGIRLLTGTVTNCAAERNLIGILTNSGCIDRCGVKDNATHGISVLSVGGAVTHCVARANLGDGIRAAHRAKIVENVATENGTIGQRGGGIHITGNHGRVERNHASGNKKDGILLDNTANGGAINTTGNFVYGNTARDNADFQFRIQGLVAGGLSSDNQVAPLQTLNTATSPFANF